MRTSQNRATSDPAEPTRVLMLDLWATVPYYTAYLSRALKQIGLRVQIASITYYLDRHCFRSRGLRLDPGLLDLVGKFDLPRVARRLGKLLEGGLNLTALTLRALRRPPEVLHVQFLPLLRSRAPMDLWFVRFCRRRGSKIVLTVHDLLPHDTGEEHLSVYQRLYAEMDALICHSAHIRARLEDEFAVPPEKISVIPHGPFFYDLAQSDLGATRQALGLAEGQQMVLWQGIIFPYKGVDLLLAAWKQVEARSGSLTLVVLGTGNPALLASLETQAQQLGLRRVQFHFRFCSTEELVAAYRAASVVVYPYRAITTSGALATGLALERAIVASDLPVFRELLTDDVNALLVKPADPDALASALLRVVQEPRLSERLRGNVADMRFGEQSWTKIAADTEQVYDQVLGR